LPLLVSQSLDLQYWGDLLLELQLGCLGSRSIDLQQQGLRSTTNYDEIIIVLEEVFRSDAEYGKMRSSCEFHLQDILDSGVDLSKDELVITDGKMTFAGSYHSPRS
jgi:hypothetical protein